MGKIIIVRHGQTNYNIERRYTGSTDISLNETGRNQARSLASKLKDLNIDIIISSTLKRAKETAEIINEAFKLPIIESEDLVEKCAGVYEGLTREEIKSKYPIMWEKNSPERAEPREEVEKRVFRALDKICSDYGDDKNILIVTHGYISKVINKYFYDSSKEEFAKYVLDNCEIEEYSMALSK